MSRSNDPGHFFQSEAAQSSAARKAQKSSNDNGQPIRLPSKILSVAADPSGASAVYVAESAGTLRRVDLASRSTRDEVYRGSEAPLTSIAFSPDGQRVYAGCWDKSVWSWERPSGKVLTRYQGHSDFVKCVLSVRLRQSGAGEAKEVLISGAQDSKIIVWDAASGAKLHTLTGHTRGVLCLALLPSSLVNPADPGEAPTFVMLFSGDSSREIRKWQVGIDKALALPASDAAEELEAQGAHTAILAHETSVNALLFPPEEEDVPVLWAASSDKTAKRLVFDEKSKKWNADTVLEHPDFVRAVVPLADSGLVATACRDEEVRVFDADNQKLLATLEGHFEEVTDLVLVGDKLVSVSIDATLRTWPASRAGVLAKAEELKKPVEKKKEEKAAIELDEDEERELAELMEDDD